MGLQALPWDMGSQVRPPAGLAWMRGESWTYRCSSPHLRDCLCPLGSSFSHGHFLPMTVWDTQCQAGSTPGWKSGT